MTIRSYQFLVQALITGSSDVTETVAQSLGLTDEAVFGAIDKSASTSLGLTDEADFVVEPSGANIVTQSLGLSDVAMVSNIRDVVQSLGITDEAEGANSSIVRSVVQSLGVSDTVDYGYLIRNLFVDQDLGITDSAGRGVDASATQSLGITDEASFTSVFQSLGLTDVAGWGYGYDAEHDLGITDAVELDKLLNQSVSEPSFLSQAAAYFIETRCGRYQFQQFHGEGGATPEDEHLNYDSTLLFQSIDDGTIITLRNPETDDRRRYAFNRVNRSFFDGTADIYADDSWVTEETQIYTIVSLKRDILDTVFTFLSDNLGRNILLKDWKGVTWNVIITNPGEVFTEDGEGRWTLDFEVVGEPLYGEQVLDYLNLTEEVSRAGSIWTRSVSDTGWLSDRANRHYDEDESQALGLTDEAEFTVV